MKTNQEISKDKVHSEAMDAIDNLERCGVALGMGLGKTYFGLKHMDKNFTGNEKFLVVAPKLSIFETWKEEAIKFDLSHLIPFISFTTYLSINKQDLVYDIIYLDECHNILETHRPYLHNFKGGILGLTGTKPKYSTSEKGKLISEFCPIVYEYGINKAVDGKLLNDYRIIVHRLPLSTEKTLKVETKKASWYTSEWESYNYWTNRLASQSEGGRKMTRIFRMKALMEYPTKEYYTAKLLKTITNKVLVFANTQKQADKLCKFSCHSKNPDSEINLQMFKEDKIRELSCVLQISEGANIPNLKEGIIMHSYANEHKLSQRFGRGLRLKIGDQFVLNILCYINTIDEVWVKQALEEFDPEKITYINGTVVE